MSLRSYKTIPLGRLTIATSVDLVVGLRYETRQSEIGHFDGVVLAYQHVGGSHVSMNVFLQLEIGHAVSDLNMLNIPYQDSRLLLMFPDNTDTGLFISKPTDVQASCWRTDEVSK